MPRFITAAPVPVQALRLNEDIRALERCRELLDTVELASISPDAHIGLRILRVTQRQLRTCQKYAEDKMKQEYLAPRRKKYERATTTEV